MPWIKKGMVYRPDGSLPHSRTHAQVPFAFPLKNGRVRIYISSRDEQSQSRPTFIEVDENDFNNVLYVHDKPVLDIGQVGQYDETGVMPSWFVTMPNGNIRLYYTGWNRNWDNSYRLAIGLAESKDGGVTFQKLFTGPVMDRSIQNPVWAAQPSIMFDDNLWKMWYIAAHKMETIDGRPEPFYRGQYAESEDGINWKIADEAVIDFDDFLHAVGRPTVFKEDGIFKMYYSFRNANQYRTDREKSYRMGYAESIDGKSWTRKDELAGIDKSDNPEDFDYLMIDYAHCCIINDKKYLFYNGNGFGASGLGYAVWEGF